VTVLRHAQGYLIHTEAFRTAWQRFIARVVAAGLVHVWFTEHDLRAKTASDAEDDGQDATELLTHDNRQTTRAYLRSRKPRDVTPLRRKLPE
jgi:hypothetical protein